MRPPPGSRSRGASRGPGRSIRGVFRQSAARAVEPVLQRGPLAPVPAFASPRRRNAAVRPLPGRQRLAVRGGIDPDGAREGPVVAADVRGLPPDGSGHGRGGYNVLHGGKRRGVTGILSQKMGTPGSGAGQVSAAPRPRAFRSTGREKPWRPARGRRADRRRTAPTLPAASISGLPAASPRPSNRAAPCRRKRCGCGARHGDPWFLRWRS